MIVDQGAIHLDGDAANHVVHIKKTLTGAQSYIKCESATGVSKFTVHGNGNT